MYSGSKILCELCHHAHLCWLQQGSCQGETKAAGGGVMKIKQNSNNTVRRTVLYSAAGKDRQILDASKQAGKAFLKRDKILF